MLSYAIFKNTKLRNKFSNYIYCKNENEVFLQKEIDTLGENLLHVSIENLDASCLVLYIIYVY